jgi:hypothetical protein
VLAYIPPPPVLLSPEMLGAGAPSRHQCCHRDQVRIRVFSGARGAGQRAFRACVSARRSPLPRGQPARTPHRGSVLVVAATQIGDREPNRTCDGRSMIVDPWGTVIAQVLDINCISGPSSSWRGWRRAELPSLRPPAVVTR